MSHLPNFHEIDKRLLNPTPLLVARRDPGGATASYACPWCGDTHTHHVRPGRAMYAKGSHCKVFEALFGFLPSTHFYLEGEIDPAEAHRRHWLRDFDIMQAER
jgi:hypothetical protein